MTVLLEMYKKYILFNMVKNHDNELSLFSEQIREEFLHHRKKDFAHLR